MSIATECKRLSRKVAAWAADKSPEVQAAAVAVRMGLDNCAHRDQAPYFKQTLAADVASLEAATVNLRSGRGR